jgi:tetratricopeptide (TPR) repeat protein/predicted Ser/Thr protein kinase
MNGGKPDDPISPDDLTRIAGSDATPFEVGQTAAARYDIIQTLGQGGMGAVYKAWDRKLERHVAIKVIRPLLASSEAVLARFKQELLITRKITHKNVIRIFDIGESNGTEFITMEFVEGTDLKKLIKERGKFTSSESIAIIKQVCAALDAAHSEGIVHRDLKPQNIMVQKNGRVVVTDFGIAHSEDAPSTTATGAVIGTPEYMSPEQAKGKKVDQRSDIFSLGLVFYELITGKLPFEADTVMESMFKRTQEPAVPPVLVERTVSPQINRVIVRCLATDPEKRYPTAVSVLTDLESESSALTMPAAVSRLLYRLPPARSFWKIAVAILFGLGLGFGFYFLRNTAHLNAPAAKSVLQVLIADFQVDPDILDTPLEPVLTLALEGASFIQVSDRQHAKSVIAEIQAKADRLDEETARLVAVREGIAVVVSGSLTRRGDRLQISAKVVDAATGRVLRDDHVDARDKSGILPALAQLGVSIRSSLGDATTEVAQLAAAETFTAGSLEAMTYYAKGQELISAGKWEEAIGYYSQAVAADPKLGRAYAGMAAASLNLGRTDDTEKYYRLALENIDRMTDREKYRTRSVYFLSVRDYDRAIEECKSLIEKFPFDTSGHNNLAIAYFHKRDMANALAEGYKFVSLYPKYVSAQNNLALYAMYAGNFDNAKVEAAKALQMTPSFVKGYLVMALSDFALGRMDEAAKTYEKMAKLSVRGASLAATGLADMRIFEGRFHEAEGILQKAISTDLENKETASAANKLLTLASVEAALNRRKEAVASTEKALNLNKDLSVVFPAARILIQTGGQVGPLIQELNRRSQREPQAHARLIEGEALLAAGKTSDAIRKFEEAAQLADTWLGRLELGRAYIDAGEFPQASAELDAALRRRGEAAALFLDDVPTYRYFPEVLYYLGRAQEGLGSPGSVGRYKAFIDIKSKSEMDPIVEDAKRRLRKAGS